MVLWITSCEFTQKVIDKHKHHRVTLIPLLNKTKIVRLRGGREEKKGMRSFSISRVLDRHTRSVAAAVGLLLATLAPAIAPAFAAAELVTDRSIALSSSTKDADGVSYQVKFTTTNVAQSLVMQFCSDTPLIGESCGAPGGFTVAGATTATSGVTITNKATANKIVLESTGLGTPGAQTIDIAGINNPTAAGALYARIVTYDDTGANALTAYTTTALGSNAKDQGSVALSITDGVNVSGKVLETLLFCVSGTAITTAGCASGITAPTLTLGETVGTVKALTSSKVSTGDIYTQLSTNAAGGVVVSLKSGNTCGGLMRQGASSCDITPSTATGFDDSSSNAAKFGVKVAADSATDTTLSATGTFRIVPTSVYDGTNYMFNWVSGNASGVSSTYGDPILDTNETQPSNKNMKLTFGASITNNTPAGNYSTDLSLIATGKF